MPAKRKSDVLDDADDFVPPASHPATDKENALMSSSASKKQKLDESGKKATTATSKGKGKKEAKPKYAKMEDVVLEGEEEDELPIYDDCNEIRRKIRALLSTPGFKITHWLKEIGNVNSNSYGRFMSLKGPDGGSSNSTYYAAYKWFERKRIFEGKPKTKKRLEREAMYARQY